MPIIVKYIITLSFRDYLTNMLNTGYLENTNDFLNIQCKL